MEKRGRKGMKKRGREKERKEKRGRKKERKELLLLAQRALSVEFRFRQNKLLTTSKRTSLKNQSKIRHLMVLSMSRW